MASKKFISGSANEKKLRICICMLGLSLLLCARAAFMDFFVSIEKTPEFLMESAFMTDSVEGAPQSFINEKQE